MNDTKWFQNRNVLIPAHNVSIVNLKPGIYSPGYGMQGLQLQKKDFVRDEIVHTNNRKVEQIIASLKRFWVSRDRYEKYRQVYKRGILLTGKPGCGKTTLCMLLAEHLVNQNNGIVLLINNLSVMVQACGDLRDMGVKNPLIVIIEDIEEKVEEDGEDELLSALDGQYQIDNIVVIATTNRIEKLSDRIVNRPSRFDEVIEIEQPTAVERRAYLKSKLNGEKIDIDKWVVDSEGFSIAHLKELFIAVCCLDADYESVVQRLRKMNTLEDSKE